MNIDFPISEQDLVMGFTLFTGAVLRYGKVVVVGVPTNPKSAPPAYLVNLDVLHCEGMQMTMVDCTFSSRKIQ